MLNLVFNALKFTPAGGTVALRVEKPGEEMIISVKDTGVGISEKNLPFVFDRFWQADNSSKRKYQGVGIGLSLVKELTEVQGGKVSVESQEGKGTTFTVRLPFLQAEAAQPSRTRSPSRAPSSPALPDLLLPTPAPTPAEPAQSEEWLGESLSSRGAFPATDAVDPRRCARRKR